MTGQDAVNIARRVPRAGRHHRRHPDQDGWRCPRRRGALDARGHRPADQVRRRRREDRRARAVSSRSRRLAHPRHGRRRLAWSRRSPRRSTARGGEARRQDAEGQLRSRGSREPAAPDAQDGRHERACSACCPASARSRSSSAEAKIDDGMIDRQVAIIRSMTPKERRNPTSSTPRASAASPRARARACRRSTGCLKQYQQMADHDEAGEEDGPQAVHGARPAARACSAALARKIHEELAGADQAVEIV